VRRNHGFGSHFIHTGGDICRGANPCAGVLFDKYHYRCGKHWFRFHAWAKKRVGFFPRQKNGEKRRISEEGNTDIDYLQSRPECFHKRPVDNHKISQI